MSRNIQFNNELERMYQIYRRLGTSKSAHAEAVLGDPIYARQARMPKWNGTVDMLREPKVALRYNTSWGIPTSKDAHRQRAEYFERLQTEVKNTYNELAQFALDTYGDKGSLISGIIHDHFPVDIKNRLRFLAQSDSMIGDAIKLHEYLSRTRSPLFR